MVSRVAEATDVLSFQSSASADFGERVEERLSTCENRVDNHLLVSYVPTPVNILELPAVCDNGEQYSRTLAGDNYELRKCGVLLYSLDALSTLYQVPGTNITVFLPVESAVSYDLLGMRRDIQLGAGFWPASSSFVPPVAIAHAIYLRSIGLEVTDILYDFNEQPIRAP